MKFYVLIFLLINFIQKSKLICDSEYINNDTSYHYKSYVYNGSLVDCECGSSNLCVRKCCDNNYLMINKTCVYHSKTTLDLRIPEVDLPLRLITGMMACPKFYKVKQEVENDFSIDSKGRFWYLNRTFSVNPDEYCLETFEGEGVEALVCFMETTEIGHTIKAIGEGLMSFII